MTENATEADDQARQERLRHNSNIDPENKTIDELNPMEADSWSGGSINPDAKKVARGELPANRVGQGDGMPTTNPPPDDSSVTRPWSPEPTGEGDPEGGVDPTGRPVGNTADD